MDCCLRFRPLSAFRFVVESYDLMSRRSCRRVVALMLCWVGLALPSSAQEIVLIGRTSIPGDATDLSGDTTPQENGALQNQLGGLGSGLAWTGKGNRYVMLPDRGPGDGATSYRCRFHVVEIIVDPSASVPVTIRLLETHFLTNSHGEHFVGRSTQFDREHPERSLRMDPEGIRVTSRGTILISEEYVPSVREFDANGKWIRDLPTPDRYRIKSPGNKPEDELPPANLSGRVTNRGWEGLGLSHDGRRIYAIIQSPLIQDGALSNSNSRVGTNLRIWEYDLQTGASREFLYPLDDKPLGCSELEVIGPDRLLVIERDGLPGENAKAKRLYDVDLSQATNIVSIERLPSTGIPEGIQPVTKRLFIDLLAPQYQLVGSEFPEKIEGVAFGPRLPDGSRVLVVASDNDFHATLPTQIYAFRVN